MKAESEVSISFAVSIFLDVKFTPDDYRINCKSYEELGLICGNCRELVFFKKGKERVSHFSHFKTTGKDCQWRTGSDSNTLHTDAESREQSLERFQAKFKSIIEQGIIKHQQISSSQLREQIKEGQKLVSTYKIDIDSWLRWFNQNRNPLRNLAKNLYQTNELVSEENQIILLNLVDYLCVPASEYILKDILYYVFGLLDKEISLKKYLEELPSKVIELMSYAEWKKEYQRAKEFVVPSKFEQNAHSDFVNSPVEVKGFVHPNIKPEESIRDDLGNVPTTDTSFSLKEKRKKLSLSNARSVATGSLEWKGFLGNVPCIVNLVNSHDHWQLEALPIKDIDIPVFPLLYVLADKFISGYWQEHDVDNFLIHPLDKEMARLDDLAARSTDPEKIEAIGRRKTSLQRLRKAVLNREKLDPERLAKCTNIVEKALKESDYRPSSTDFYYSRYILGQVYFVSQIEDSITYLLDDYMSHKRIPTQVGSAINWLKLVPQKLKKQFPSRKPSLKELQKYLYPLWNKKFNTEYRGLELKIREEGNKTLIDILHNDKVQITQLLTAKKAFIPTGGKNVGKVFTKVATTLNFSEISVFEKFLRTKDGRFVAEAQNQLRHLVNVFLSRNFNTLVGEGKVGHQRKVSEIIGFERSKSGWSEIKNGFVKVLLPYSSDSEVEAGKLVYLATNQILSSQDLEHLIVQIAENWKNWSRKDQPQIKIGSGLAKNSDPQILSYVLTKKILSGNFEEDKEAWQDTINWFAEVCKSSNEYRAIGFRFDNGVILTPDSIYDSDVEKWMHRIKIQLIDLLLKSGRGNIEAWLQKSPQYLYDALEKVRPNWDNNPNIAKHLEAMHNALNISIKVEESKKD